MLRILFCLLCASLCAFGFLLEDQKPANDHDLLRYVDSVVTNLVNMTTKLEKDIASKNDLTQFLQSDLRQINASLQEEKQKSQALELKVSQLENRLVNPNRTEENTFDIALDKNLKQLAFYFTSTSILLTASYLIDYTLTTYIVL